MNIPALFNVLRVSTTATDKRAWATKSVAYATLSGLLMAALPFVPPQYAQYFNADWVNYACQTVIGVAAAFGVFGTTSLGILPVAPVPVSELHDSGPNDLSGGA